MTFRATTELVAVTWFGGVTGLSPSIVATTLPKDNTTWSASGFVTARTVGGTPGLYTPLRTPVVTVDCWSVNPSSGKPPWGKANYLAELIDAGCRATNMQRTLTLPTNYPSARVLSAYLISEPRRAYGDEADYARYVMDMVFNWVDLS